MKQLNSFMVLRIGGGDRISFTFDEINQNGEPVSTNNKQNFYVVDDFLKNNINYIRQYIENQKLKN